MRYAFIKTLSRLAQKNPQVMLLTADLGFTVFESFQETYPSQFVNIGVAEQNAVGIAAGLALTGKVPFVYTIATFATLRPFEQIKLDVGLHNLPVKIVGTGAGLSYAEAGPTHHAIEDIALMRLIPNISILCPADPYEAEWATEEAFNIKGPVYLRLGKKGEPSIYGERRPNLVTGKSMVLHEGKDAVIVTTGNIVYSVLQAVKVLHKQQFDVSVIHIPTIQPLDIPLLEQQLKKYTYIFTVEEHLLTGGLGSLIADVVAGNGWKSKLVKMGIPKPVFTVGSQEYLRQTLGLDVVGISEKIRATLKK